MRWLTTDPPRPLRSVLVANRGEIAVRILRAARAEGIRAIAVHTPDEAEAWHVRHGHEAHLVPDYRDAAALIAAARSAGAEAVHPGYGFLAENAEFAAAVEGAGLVWVGAPPTVIADLGDKLTARRIAAQAGAPLAPGGAEPVRAADQVRAFAAEHGLPLLIKAAAGGGGRGMRVVSAAAEIPAALAAATREAAAAFGDDACYLERYLPAARHIEAQVLADGAGRVVIVGTRECSIQRRNQKLIEEAPAPFLDPATAHQVHGAARAIVAAVGYRGAGTVEFLLASDGSLAFLEVNTRLQVEHPVTEVAYDVDLVAEQFRVAGGAELLTEDDPSPRGHAIEFRLVAEDPRQGFRPSPGVVRRLRVPSGAGLRCDAGLIAGEAISGRYDSMFAKLVVSGATRAQALARAAAALAQTEVVGVATPLDCYRRIVGHPDMRGPDYRVHNRWLEQDPAAVGWVVPGPDPEVAGEVVEVRIGRRLMPVAVPGFEVLGARGDDVRVELAERRSTPESGRTGPEVRAPMQGTITEIAVTDGDQVAEGDLVAICEAMKMANPVRAHRAGTITDLGVTVGANVTHEQTLCRVL